MIFSLISGAISMLNAAGFLLMAAGPSLLDFIVISSIYSVASWIYSWILPAAIGYRQDKLPQLRLLQTVTVAISATLILGSHPSSMALLFVGMMLVDAWVFPHHILLFRSETALFIRIELARGFANSVALFAVFFLLDREPFYYVLLLFVNVMAMGLVLAVAGMHRPPALRISPPAEVIQIICASLFSRQFVALLLARGIETGTMLVLSQMQALSAVLSLKIGIAVSSTLAANARQRSLPLLWAVLGLVYSGGTMVILLLDTLPIDNFSIPETLLLVNLPNAVMVLPVVLAAFTLTVFGLRISAKVKQPSCKPSLKL